MKEVLRKTVPVGFVFGIFFSVFAYVSNYVTEPLWLLLMPVGTVLLCAFAGLLAAAVVGYLSKHYSLSGPVAVTIAFIVAALVNVLIVYIGGSLFGILSLNSRLLIGVVPGLGLGAAYAAYRYNVDTLSERMEFFKAMAEKNKQLQDASRRLAIIEERNRMGRELHDSVSQGLHGLVFSIHSLRNSLDNPNDQVLSILTHMEGTANSTLAELRAMIEELKPSLLAEHGLKESLRIIGDLFSQSYNIPIEYSYEVTAAMSPELETTMYRVTQEALANIGRHAAAKHAHLKVIADKDRVLLTISDDGIGFDTHSSSKGNGLENMRQRIGELGGTLKTSSRSGLGTTISAEFPTKG